MTGLRVIDSDGREVEIERLPNEALIALIGRAPDLASLALCSMAACVRISEDLAGPVIEAAVALVDEWQAPIPHDSPHVRALFEAVGRLRHDLGLAAEAGAISVEVK